jgi:hypothetical protein
VLTNPDLRSIIPPVRRLILLGILVGLVAGPTLAHAVIYCWRDEQGVTNYVDDSSKVPPEYREGVFTVESTAQQTEPRAETPTADEVARSNFAEGFRAGMTQANGSDLEAPRVVQNVQIVESVPSVPLFGAVFIPSARVRPRHPIGPRSTNPCHDHGLRPQRLPR